MSSKMLYDIFSYTPLPSNEGEVREFVRKYPSMGLPPLIDTRTYLGIEVEVERIADRNITGPLWRVVEDGSLRNGGYEFVSIPMRGEAVPIALDHLRQFLVEKNKGHEFSNRTSIHVHMNARDMSVEQVFSFVILYLAFENILYKAVFDLGKKDREKNIFCLPINQALDFFDLDKCLSHFVAGRESTAIELLTANWRKYTGLNVLPLREHGTIEFRHMGGMLHIEHLITWINLILSIRKHACQYRFTHIKDKILALNTNSMYEHFTNAVFHQFAAPLLQYNIKEELEAGVIVVKRALTDTATPKLAGGAEGVKLFLGSTLRLMLEQHGYKFNSADALENKKKLQEEREILNKKILTLSEERALIHSQTEMLSQAIHALQERHDRARSTARRAEYLRDMLNKRDARVALRNQVTAKDKELSKAYERLNEIDLVLGGGDESAKKLSGGHAETGNGTFEWGFAQVHQQRWGPPEQLIPAAERAMQQTLDRWETQRPDGPVAAPARPDAQPAPPPNAPRDPRRGLRNPWTRRR